MFQRGYPHNHIWAPTFKKLIPKTRQLWIDWLFSFSLPFSSQWFKTYLQHFCTAELLLGILWLFLSFITEISLFRTSSCRSVLLWLCLLQWIQWDKAKGLSTSPWLPLTFGCQQTPGSSADGCLWACIAWAWLAKAKNHFLTIEVTCNPVTSHPSHSLPLPHIQEPRRLIHDYIHVNTGLYIFTLYNTTVLCYSCFSLWIITLEPCSSGQPSFFQKENLQNENFLLKSSSV